MKHFTSVTKAVPARASILGWLKDLIGAALGEIWPPLQNDTDAPRNPYEDLDLGSF